MRKMQKVVFSQSDSSRTGDEQQSDSRRTAIHSGVGQLFVGSQTAVCPWTEAVPSRSPYQFALLKGSAFTKMNH